MRRIKKRAKWCWKEAVNEAAILCRWSLFRLSYEVLVSLRGTGVGKQPLSYAMSLILCTSNLKIAALCCPSSLPIFGADFKIYNSFCNQVN
jgi:hypothetical protein